MSDIQEEQKRLYKRAEENDIRHFILETKDYGNFDVVEYEKYKELQNRINKATNYINENWGHWCSNHCKYATETINILKGDNK